MKTYTLSEIANRLRYQSLESGSFENLLTYFTDDDMTQVTGNLNTGIKVEIDDPSLLEPFHITTDMFWPQISQKIYGTDSMYWFLQLLNPYVTESPFGKVKAPKHIMYLPDALTVVRNA